MHFFPWYIIKGDVVDLFVGGEASQSGLLMTFAVFLGHYREEGIVVKGFTSDHPSGSR